MTILLRLSRDCCPSREPLLGLISKEVVQFQEAGFLVTGHVSIQESGSLGFDEVLKYN